MADIVADGRTRVSWVTTIANIAAPTTAELNAGMLLHSTLTADGLSGFRPEQTKVPSTALDSTSNTQRNGRVNFEGMMLRLKKQTGTDTIYNTLVKDVEGYVVIRNSSTASTAWAAGDKVRVYPVVCGETAWMDPEENTLERYEVPLAMTAQPNQRAVVA